MSGSCGTSTYTGQRVLVENIETDPKWEKISNTPYPMACVDCWSEPIKDSSGKVFWVRSACTTIILRFPNTAGITILSLQPGLRNRSWSGIKLRNASKYSPIPMDNLRLTPIAPLFLNTPCRNHKNIGSA